MIELSDELIGANIKEFQENFLNKIELAAESIIAEVRGATLELNHSDLKILQENSKVKDFGFQLLEKSDLRRGEFRLITDSLGFEQKIIGEGSGIDDCRRRPIYKPQAFHFALT